MGRLSKSYYLVIHGYTLAELKPHIQLDIFFKIDNILIVLNNKQSLADHNQWRHSLLTQLDNDEIDEIIVIDPNELDFPSRIKDNDLNDMLSIFDLLDDLLNLLEY